LIRGASTGGKSLTQECRPVFFDLRDAFSFGDRDWLGSHAAIGTFYLTLVLLLFSYGPDAMDQFQHAAGCVDRIDSESYSAVVLYRERCGDLESALPKSRGRKPKKPRAPTKGAPKQLIAHNASKRELPIPAQTEQETINVTADCPRGTINTAADPPPVHPEMDNEICEARVGSSRHVAWVA
jgi:hypothetical protein